MNCLFTFEARVYNRVVRNHLETGEVNTTGFSDKWADTHLVQVRARSRAEASALLARDYPEAAGFLVTDLIEVPDPYAR